MRLKAGSTLLLACIASVAAASPAVAQEMPASPEPYSGQILAADLGAMLLSLSAAGMTNEGAFVLLAPLGGPTVHALHGHPGRALGSLLLNVALPVAGGYVGYRIDAASCGPDAWFCGVGGLVLGGLAGIVTAMVTDAAVLARLPEDDTALAHVTTERSITPLFAVNHEGSVALGVAGRF